MHKISGDECQAVSAGYVTVMLQNGHAILITTDDSRQHHNGYLNGALIQLNLYADRIEDLSGQIVLAGNKGTLCHNNRLLYASPYEGGMQVVLGGAC